jgi:hypothetical protein
VFFLSGLLGNLFGILIGTLLPDGALHAIVAKEYEYGVKSPMTLDLWFLSISAGFIIRLNGCALLFMFLGTILYKKA